MNFTNSVYVSLPSNVKTELYKNKSDDYKTPLAQPLELEGKWEVALTSIQYLHGWFNITKPTPLLVILVRGDNMYDPQYSHPRYTAEQLDWGYITMNSFDRAAQYDLFQCEFPPGYYKSVEELGLYLAKVIDDGYKRYCDPFRTEPDHIVDFHYDRQRETCQFTSKPCNFIIVTRKDEPLMKCLGLVGVECEMPEGIAKFKKKINTRDFGGARVIFGPELSVVPPEILANNLNLKMYVNSIEKLKSEKPTMINTFPALYVYSDIVDYRPVGNTMAPLLSTVPITGAHGEYQMYVASRPIYQPVSRGYISTIEMLIRDDTGEPIDFRGGKVICDLHFRKCGLGL